MKKAKNRVFRGFFIMYLSFTLALLVFFVPLYIYILDVSSENATASASKHLSSGAASLDASFRALYGVANSTNNNRAFRMLKYATVQHDLNVIQLSEMQQLLASFLSDNAVVNDAGILIDSSLVLTRARSFYSNTFYDFYGEAFVCEDISYDAWLEMLSPTAALLPVMRYTSWDYGTYDALTFTCDWPTPANEDSLFYANISTNALTSLLMEEKLAVCGSLRLTGPTGETLYEILPKEYPSFKKISAPIPSLGLHAEIGIPNAILLKQTGSLRRLMVIYASVVGVVAVCLVLWFSRKSTSPVQRVLFSFENAKHLNRPSDPHPAKSDSFSFYRAIDREYSKLASSLSRIDSQIGSYLHLIDEQDRLLQSQLFDKTLYRGLNSSKNQADFQRYFPNFPAQFQLARFRIEPLSNAETASYFISSLHSAFPGQYVHHLSSDTVILVLEASFHWPDTLEPLRSHIETECQAAVTCILTEPFTSPMQLDTAFQRILDAELVGNTSAFIHLEQFCEGIACRRKLPMNMHELFEFYDALNTADETKALALFKIALDRLFESDDSLATAPQLYRMIECVFTQMKMEKPAACARLFVPPFDRDNIRQLFTHQIPFSISAMCIGIRSATACPESFAETVMAYINKNIFSQDLCLDSVTEALAVSKSTLQKTIKAQTGTSFFAYIEEQRIDRARKLLAEGKLPVQQVAEMCGFASSNSFYKAFRRKLGVSPSEASSLACDC